jgi:hypothetical protein
MPARGIAEEKEQGKQDAWCHGEHHLRASVEDDQVVDVSRLGDGRAAKKPRDLPKTWQQDNLQTSLKRQR